MDPNLWADLWPKAHGATTHFPIALALMAVLAEVAAFVGAERPVARTLHAVGYWTILLGAVGSVGAVVSGLLMTKGSVLGHDTLRRHHLFVWPAFALLVGLATWRVLIGGRASRGAMGVYLLGLAAMAGLMAAAGYYGAEMMIAR